MPTPDDIEMDLLHHLKEVNGDLLEVAGMVVVNGWLTGYERSMYRKALKAIKKAESQS